MRSISKYFSSLEAIAEPRPSPPSTIKASHQGRKAKLIVLAVNKDPKINLLHQPEEFRSNREVSRTTDCAFLFLKGVFNLLRRILITSSEISVIGWVMAVIEG